MPAAAPLPEAKSGTGRTVRLHPQEALLQQARARQQSEAFSEYRQRRVAVEYRLARLVQLGIRQSRYFGRAKTRFQLYLAATVANLILVAAKAGMTGETGHGPSGPGRWHGQLRCQFRGRVARANSDPHFARVGLTDQNPSSHQGVSVRICRKAAIGHVRQSKILVNGCLSTIEPRIFFLRNSLRSVSLSSMKTNSSTVQSKTTILLKDSLHVSIAGPV